jgi:Zn-dependent protease with chaperone function
LAIVLIIVAIYAAIVIPLTYMHGGLRLVGWWHPQILAVVAFLTVGVVALGTLYKVWELSSNGGERLATTLGGRQINPDTVNLAERRLLNVVEEMALAAGVPVPAVYLLDNEPGINAFAAGYSPGDAVIGVNRGTIEHLSRDELQGVIGHEFSHVLHGDMRLNLRLIGLLHGILLIALVGYVLMRLGGKSSGSSSRGKGGIAYIALLGAALYVIGYIGLFFARLIKAGISRQREYLADASAVQYTRNPDGIAGALKKIGGLLAGSHIASPAAETTSHMFFGSAYRQVWFQAFATHPPLEDRVRRIDPQFDGTFPAVAAVPSESPKQEVLPQPQRRVRVPVPSPVLGKPFERLPLDPAIILAAVGSPAEEHVAYARNLTQGWPEPLRTAAQDPFSARAIVLALLIDRDPQIRERQLAAVGQKLGDATRSETEKLVPLVVAAGPPSRLPLVELVHGTLRQMSPDQYRLFRGTVEELVEADQRISLFEFSLQRGLLRRLDRQFAGGPPPRALFPALRGVRDDLVTLLSVVAHLGHKDENEAKRAFAESMRLLDIPPDLPMRAREQTTLAEVGVALDKLALTTPPIKKRVLRAAISAASLDGRVTLGEAEMIRAIADTLDCPIPPLLAESSPL